MTKKSVFKSENRSKITGTSPDKQTNKVALNDP